MPKPYVRKMPATWWLQKPAYVKFMLRELTAVFVAAYCVLLLIALWKLKHSPAAFDAFLSLLQTPWLIAFHAVAFLAAMYHTLTWFALVPKVLVVRVGEEKVSPVLLVASHWLLWLLVSIGLVWLAFK